MQTRSEADHDDFVIAALETVRVLDGPDELATYVRSFNPGSLYQGTIAAMVVVVIWVYYAALIFILGGEVGQVYELRRTRKRQREAFLD